jgi:8-oxo-dGTP diphosphatase
MQRIASMLVESNCQILLMTRSDNKLWCPPGGKVKKHEYILEGGIRELKEEVGITTNPQSCFPLTFTELDGKLFFFYWVPIWNGSVLNLEPEKCEGVSWHSTLPDNMVPAIAFAREAINMQLAMHRKQYSFLVRGNK